MGNPVDAKKAFRALAYSRFRSQPLYLEWAPFDVMGDTDKTTDKAAKSEKSKEKEKKSKRDMTYEEKIKERKNRQAGIVKEEPEEDSEGPEDVKEESEDVKPSGGSDKQKDDKEIESGSALFVKNLAFDTTDSSLETMFR